MNIIRSFILILYATAMGRGCVKTQNLAEALEWFSGIANSSMQSWTICLQ